MHWLADEDIPKDVVTFLRSLKHDVCWISTESPGIQDTEVLDKSYKEKRVLLTNDTDFGNLIFREKYSSSGVILFRLKNENVEVYIQILEQIILKHSTDLKGLFIIANGKKLKVRKL